MTRCPPIDWRRLRTGEIPDAEVIAAVRSIPTHKSGMGLLLGVDVQPAAGGNSPPLTNLVMWLKADAESYTNGQSVGTWHDQSGNGNNMTQATGANQGVFTTSVINSLPAINFSSGKGMTSSLSVVKPFTIFWVELSVDQASVTGHSFSRAVCSSTANCLGSVRRTDGNSAFVQGNVASYSPGDLNPHYACIRIGTTASAYRVDGVDHTLHAAQVADWGTFAIGTSGQFGENVYAQLAEILVYSAELSGTVTGQVESYLHTKYAI